MSAALLAMGRADAAGLSRPVQPLPAAPPLAVVLDMDGVTTPASGARWTGLGQEFLRGVAPGWSEGDLAHIKWKSLPEVHRWITENRGAQLSYEEYARRREALSARIYGELAELEPTFRQTQNALKAQGVIVLPAEAFVVGRVAPPHAVRVCLGAARDRQAVAKGRSVLAATLAGAPRPTAAVV